MHSVLFTKEYLSRHFEHLNLLLSKVNIKQLSNFCNSSFFAISKHVLLFDNNI